MKDYPWPKIKPADILNTDEVPKFEKMWSDADSIMKQRTQNFDYFTKIAHNQSLFDNGGSSKKVFSEGSTQAIKRKIRAQTIQRVPDGEIVTQFDRNSIEQVITEFLFDTKVLTSEYDGHDMMKNLWRLFNDSYDFGFGCVVTGFEHDLDSDIRISWRQIPYNDVRPAPDCDFIEEAEWYLVRTWVPRSELEARIDEETGNVSDPTFEGDTVRFLLQEDYHDATEVDSAPIADKNKAVFSDDKIEVRTLYRRGDDEFVSYVPSVNAILRRVKNEDPRRDVPVHFLILEPDPQYPLGCSSVYWTLAQQQFADAFQTTSYRELLLSANPPLMAFGNISYPTLAMRPGALWNMGTNQNNHVEKFPVETTTLTQFGAILENVSANMMKNLNITDATVASDANVMTYSGTPQGVEQQRADKTITVNQYQKRVEIFFSEWANHALRSYISCMSGEVQLTVNEETRRKIWDIEMTEAQHQAQDAMQLGMEPNPPKSIIEGDKITVDFSKLSADLLEFSVRTGSLIENQREQERAGVQELLLPLSQMLSGVSEQNKGTFEHVILMLTQRLCELSDIDIPMQTGDQFNMQLLQEVAKANMEAIMGQQQQLDQQGAAINQLMQQQGQIPQQQAPMPPAAPSSEMPPEMMMQEEIPQGQEIPEPMSELPMPQPQEVSAEFPPGAEVEAIPQENF